MFLTNTRTALKHIWRNKLYTSINVIGLSLAICCVLLAVWYMKDERSFDNFHKNQEHLYRIVTSSSDENGNRTTVAATGQPQGPAFHAAVPEVQNYVRVMGGDIKSDVNANDKTLNLQMLFVDENFFEVFSFPLLKGNKEKVLSDISSVVITESIARRYFNSIDVIGKMITSDSDPSADKLGKPLVIAGVAKDPPKNSSIRFDIVLPLRYMQLSFTDYAWLNQYLGTFVQLRPGANTDEVARKFDAVFAIHAGKQVSESKRLYNHDPKISYGLQPVRDMHLEPLAAGGGGREGGIVNESNPVFSWLFLGISLFILFMAAVNVVNISIAGSLKRAKEVGVRKITGGARWQIIFQFLFESGVVCVIAFISALFLAQALLPLFNQLSGKQLVFEDSLTFEMIASLVAILIGIVLLTGFYPAYVLSAFRPKEVLYNRLHLSGRNLFGNSLVVIQFSLAVFFIIATIIYYQQMDFIRTRDLGYDPYQVVRTHIRGNRDYKAVREVFRHEILKEPAVQHVSFGADGQLFDVKLGNKTIAALHEIIDEQRLPVMQLKLKLGRNISSAIPSDRQHAVIVNETFVRAAGLDAPIGTQFYTNDRFDKDLKTIVGVVEDFHSGSLHEPIKPMVMFECDWISGGIWVRIEKQNQQRALKAIEAGYKAAMPTALFAFQFLDELNAKAYEQEQRWQKIIGIATIISIIICCLGLFGLAHLAAHRRTREIGIRKVLGASVSGIASLLTKDFLRLVVISLAIASPLAWWIMNNWLQEFAYRIQMGWWMFIVAGVTAIVIAIAAVSFHAIRAALANPVKSLRTE